MKCINRWLSLIIIYSILLISITGCGKKELPLTYERTANIPNAQSMDQKTDTFASDICVINGNLTEGTDVSIEEQSAAGLFDVNGNKVIYAKNIHERLNPASLTKVMTALVASGVAGC